MMMEAATAGEARRVVGMVGAVAVVAVRLAVATLWWGGGRGRWWGRWWGWRWRQ